MALHQFLRRCTSESLAQMSMSLLGADKRDDANQARVRSLLGKGLDLIIRITCGLGSNYVAALLAACPFTASDLLRAVGPSVLGLLWDAQDGLLFPDKTANALQKIINKAEVLLRSISRSLGNTAHMR